MVRLIYKKLEHVAAIDATLAPTSRMLFPLDAINSNDRDRCTLSVVGYHIEVCPVKQMDDWFRQTLRF
jgi:hypothetical protein